MNSSPTATANSPTAVSGLEIPADVAEHCQKHDLFGLLELAFQIATKSFTLAGPIKVELEIDVDSDDERPLLIVPVAATTREARRQYNDYMREWGEQAPLALQLRIGLFRYLMDVTDESSRI